MGVKRVSVHRFRVQGSEVQGLGLRIFEVYRKSEPGTLNPGPIKENA